MLDIDAITRRDATVWVTMTDRFMSGWGQADGKNNKLVFVCVNGTEAETVAENARNRSDMKYVNICYTKPHYSPASNFVQIKTKADYPSWYEPGYF